MKFFLKNSLGVLLILGLSSCSDGVTGSKTFTTSPEQLKAANDKRQREYNIANLKSVDKIIYSNLRNDFSITDDVEGPTLASQVKSLKVQILAAARKVEIEIVFRGVKTHFVCDLSIEDASGNPLDSFKLSKLGQKEAIGHIMVLHPETHPDDIILRLSMFELSGYAFHSGRFYVSEEPN